MQRVYKENEWGKVSKRIITIPPSILQGSQTWCTMDIIKTFTSCISPFFIYGSSTPNYTLLSSLVIKLLFLSAVDKVVTILFVYSTSYFIAIWCMVGLPLCLTLHWMVERGMEIRLLKDWRVVDGVQHWCQSVVCGCCHLTWWDEMEFVWRMKWT